MRTNKNVLWATTCALCFAAGVMVGPSSRPLAAADEKPAPAKPESLPQEPRLGANLWMQTAAEYRACCLQTYNLAGDRLEALVKSAGNRLVKPAVIMDLDETVFDNGRFQSFLHLNGLQYKEALWARYEENFSQEVDLVPGAKRFIQRAERLGVTVVYISNRTDVHQESTIKALQRNGFNTNDIATHLLLKKKGGTADKTARREAVANDCTVLMLLGDNLRDFSDAFAVPKIDGDDSKALQAEILARYAKVDLAVNHWGSDWFILPNPSYGEWDRVLGNKPIERLHPSAMKP